MENLSNIPKYIVSLATDKYQYLENVKDERMFCLILVSLDPIKNITEDDYVQITEFAEGGEWEWTDKQCRIEAAYGGFGFEIIYW